MPVPGKQATTFKIACDCKSPSCIWRVSCVISLPTINSADKSDSRICNLIYPYYSLIKSPTLNSTCPSKYQLAQKNHYYTKSLRSKSHPQAKDISRSKLHATYQKGIKYIIFY